MIRRAAGRVFEVTGKNPTLDIAPELEQIALEDENVDFCPGAIYQAMGFRPEMFTVLFAIPRRQPIYFLVSSQWASSRHPGVDDRPGLHDLRAGRREP